MSTQRKEVISWKKVNGKSFPVRLGSAVTRDDGSIAVYLDAIPAPVDGQYVLSIQEPRERGDREQAAPRERQGYGERRGGAAPAARDFQDDDIPWDR